MADRHIDFKAVEVRALLDGRKTMTRRILKPQPLHLSGQGKRIYADADWRKSWRDDSNDDLPYTVGDRLWVRESVGRRPASFLGIEAKNGVESAFYVADGEDVIEKQGFNLCPWWPRMRPLPPIHMPRWASRLTLTVTAVKVERLQEISKEDARAEGVLRPMKICDDDVATYVEAFADLWNSLHGPSAWDANPWVAAVSFTVERGNIDAGRG